MFFPAIRGNVIDVFPVPTNWMVASCCPAAGVYAFIRVYASVAFAMEMSIVVVFPLPEKPKPSQKLHGEAPAGPQFPAAERTVNGVASELLVVKSVAGNVLTSPV